MSRKSRYLSMALAVFMVLSLFTAFPTFALFTNVSAADSFTKDFTANTDVGDELAKLNVAAPAEVNNGEEFELVLTFSEIKYNTLEGEAVGTAEAYFNIDTRYIVYTGVKSIDGIDDLANVEDMSSGPAEAATDGNYMKEVKVSLFLKEEAARTAITDTLAIHVGFKAVAVGTTDAATWNYAALGSYPKQTGNTVFVADGNEKGVELGWTVNVVGEDTPKPEIKLPLTNVAGQAQYRGTGTTNGTTSKYAGEANWNEYHTGKLNDGILSTLPTDDDANDPDDTPSLERNPNVEIYLDGFVGGTVFVYFKFEEAKTVSEVRIHTNDRVRSSNRGQPNMVNVYVGNSEDDHNDGTLLGYATSDLADEYLQTWTATGEAKEGTYVILEMEIDFTLIMIALHEVEIMAVAEPSNQAPNATYKGTGYPNYSSEREAWLEYNEGKLNDGVIATSIYEETDAQSKAENLDLLFNSGADPGDIYIYFKFGAVMVSEVNVYANLRAKNGVQGNRRYPTDVQVYVGDSEDVESATLLGEATTADETMVRKYTASSEEMLTGKYVIVKLHINPAIVLTEIEIIGYSEAEGGPVGPELPKLDAPVLTGNIKDTQTHSTYDNPTVTWEPVEGAVSYNAYVNGALVKEGITGTSYTTELTPGIDFNSANDYTKLQIEAVGDGQEKANSELSESYNFFLVSKPIDLRGNEVTSADFIIDPGHGGSDSGAVGPNDRYEKDDALKMSLEVGRVLESLGYTVAFTKITDMSHPLMSRAAKANAGDFKASLVIHRNSYESSTVGGLEILYEEEDAVDQAYAKLVHDAIMAVKNGEGKSLFNDRGLKPRGPKNNNNLVLTSQTRDDIPLAYVELAFITNESDNANFDTYFKDLAVAIAKGAIQQIGDKVGFEGAATVDGKEVAITGEPATADVTLEAGENAKFDVALKLTHALGIKGLQYSTDGNTWNDVDISALVKDNTLDGYKQEFDFTSQAAGDYKLSFRVKNATNETENNATEVVLTVNVKVDEKPVRLLGDVNKDGIVDNQDAAMVLKYDAHLAELSDEDWAFADVNGDDVVDNADAALILRYDAKLITEFKKA